MSAKKSRTCESCRWFEPNNPEHPSFGRCCRYPPRVVADARDGVDTHWPDVARGSFCGEWASKSTKAKEVTK